MYGILSKARMAIVVGIPMISIGVAGCGAGSVPVAVQEPAKAVSQSAAREEDRGQNIPPAWYEGELPILRYQIDTARERGWILTRMGVLILDFKTRQTAGYIPLPDWHWAGEAFSCPPDLALGPKGEALISSNVVPALWRVDPVTLAVSRHELAIDAHTDKDVGFTGLVYSAEQGAFFAVSDFGALWRIDPLFSRAQNIPLSAPLSKTCGIAIRSRASDQQASQLVGRCARAGQENWVVSLTPDQRSGYIRAEFCRS